MKRVNLKVKQIINEEESKFQEEGANSFVLMSVKNFLLFLFTLKARLTYSILIAQAKRLYAEYCKSKGRMGEHPSYYTLVKSGQKVGAKNKIFL